MQRLSMLIMLCGLQFPAVAPRDVPFPPTGVASGAVVTILDLREGRVRATETTYGSEPFAVAASEAFSEWVFAPAKTGKLLAVTVFRAPHLFSQSSGAWSIGPWKAPAGIPAPALLTEPAYPANATGDGNVVVHLEIDDKGSVGGTLVLKPLGGFTAACVEAAKGWRFVPARAGDDAAMASEAVAICVFKAPLGVKPPGL